MVVAWAEWERGTRGDAQRRMVSDGEQRWGRSHGHSLLRGITQQEGGSDRSPSPFGLSAELAGMSLVPVG